MKKIIFTNILILFFVFLFSELFIWNKLFRNNNSFFPNYSYRDNFKLSKLNRAPVGIDYKKTPILLLGCSYAYGHGLTNDENFASQLSQETKRPVYNWAYIGDGPINNILKLRESYNKTLLEKGSPEYVIYTYMFDQTLRMSYYQRSLMYFTRLLYYARKENLIPKQRFIPFFDRFYTVQYFRDKLWNNYLFNHQKFDNTDIFFDYLKFIFITMKKETKKLFPNSKFVILLYYENMDDIYGPHKNFYEQIYNTKRWKELENEGIIVINTKDLTGITLSGKYMQKNDFTYHPHPSKEAWKIIVPKLTEKLAL